MREANRLDRTHADREVPRRLNDKLTIGISSSGYSALDWSRRMSDVRAATGCDPRVRYVANWCAAPVGAGVFRTAAGSAGLKVSRIGPTGGMMTFGYLPWMS